MDLTLSEEFSPLAEVGGDGFAIVFTDSASGGIKPGPFVLV